MTDLSPAAKAVEMAFWKGVWYNNDIKRRNIAAALRAAADQVNHHWDGMECVDYLCAIANELEQA
jgi:hypothetical protein